MKLTGMPLGFPQFLFGMKSARNFLLTVQRILNLLWLAEHWWLVELPILCSTIADTARLIVWPPLQVSSSPHRPFGCGGKRHGRIGPEIFSQLLHLQSHLLLGWPPNPGDLLQKLLCHLLFFTCFSWAACIGGIYHSTGL